MNVTDPSGDRAAVRVVVVNFNTGSWLRRCVEALQRSTTAHHLSIVDNGSDDASLDYCRQLERDGLAQVQFNEANRGFSAACNQVALACDEPRVCFVNPDCEVAPDALAVMAAALDTDPAVALVGGAVTDEDGRIQRGALRKLPAPGTTLVTALGLERLGFRGVNLGAQWPPHATRVEAVSGALMLVRTAAFRSLGGFDEGYFLHCEDLDLFARLQNAGWAVVLEPAAGAVHGKGVSHRRQPLLAQRWKHASLKRYFRRHVAGSGLTAALWSLAISAHFLVTAPFQR